MAMRHHYTSTLIVFVLFQIQLCAQSLNLSWQIKENIAISHINSAIPTSDNRLLIIGMLEGDRGKSKGVLLFIDEKTGATTKPKTFLYENNDVNNLVSAIEIESGGFYLIGQTALTVKDKTVGWIVAVNESGELLGNNANKIVEDYSYFETAIKDTDGKTLIIGQKQSTGLGILHWKKTPSDLVVPASLKPLNGVLSTYFNTDNTLFLAGKTVDESTAWQAEWQEENSKSTLYKNSIFSPIPEVKAAHVSDKTVFMGTTFVKGRSQIWVGQGSISEKQLTENLLSDSKATEDFHAFMPMSSGQYLVAYSAREAKSGFSKNSLFILNADKKQTRKAVYTEGLGYKRDFEVMHLVEGFNNKIYVVGKSEQDDKASWRVLAYQWAEASKSIATSSSKDIGDVFKCSKAEFDDTEFENGDKILSPNERGAAIFLLETSAPISKVSIEAYVKNFRGVNCSGIRHFNLQNGKARISFPMGGTAELMSGTAEIQFSIKADGYPLQVFSMNVNCHNPLSKRGSSTIVDYEDKSLKSGKKTVSTPSISIKGKVFTPPSSSPKVTINNAAKENAMLQRSYDVNNMSVYQFEQVINLKEGFNEIPVKIEDENGILYDTIKIHYARKLEQKPTLHVIAIAPQYSNPQHRLSFNKKDADDFTALAQRQLGKGLFGDVKIKKLTSTDETQSFNIEKVFRDYVRRAKKGYEGSDAIGDQDVIWVFFSSHGKLIKNRFKILPSNYDETDEEEQEKTSVDYRSAVLDKLQDIVKTELEDTNKRKIIIFIDACHSGGAKSKGDITDVGSAAVNALNSAAAGIVTVSSTTDSLLSYEDMMWQNGAFTKALVEALDNQKVILKNNKTIQADVNQNKIITIDEMYNFIKMRVPDLIQQIHGSSSTRQMPFIPIRQLEDILPMVRVN